MKPGVLTALGALFLTLAGVFYWQIRQWPPVSGSPVIQTENGPPQRVEWFSLTERSGRTITLDDLKGKTWVASFFFTNCPGVCLKLNQTIAELQKEFPDPGIEFVSITVDPDNDTPERLTEYAARFQADPNHWLFLTGPFNQIKLLAEKSFHVSAGPAVHSDRLMLVDRFGQVQGSFRGSDDAQVGSLKRKIVEVTKEKA